jgi:hypothetical protein
MPLPNTPSSETALQAEAGPLQERIVKLTFILEQLCLLYYYHYYTNVYVCECMCWCELYVHKWGPGLLSGFVVLQQLGSVTSKGQVDEPVRDCLPGPG